MSSNDQDDKKDNIVIKKGTFYKIAVIGMIALMVSAFFAGYNLHDFIKPTSLVVTPTNFGNTGGINNNNNQLQPNTNQPSPENPSLPSLAPTTISEVNLDNDPIQGNNDAPITVVEFSDYQCPFCKRTFDNIMPELKEKYVDTGKVKHVFRDYPLPFHQNGIPAAIAAECANEQGNFWQYHDILFSKQAEWENLSGNATNEKFKEYVNNMTQVDTSKFNSCVDSQKYKDEVEKDIADGSTYGVSGTPTFYIGNKENGYTQIVGAQPLASFENIINKLSSPSNSTQ